MEPSATLITGARTGIGRATAFAFAGGGRRLAVSGRHPMLAKRWPPSSGPRGAEAVFIRADVRHEDDVPVMVDATVARFGRIDFAVNNAGTEGEAGPIGGRTTSRSPLAQGHIL